LYHLPLSVIMITRKCDLTHGRADFADEQ
jgi:hypothetical protein